MRIKEAHRLNRIHRNAEWYHPTSNDLDEGTEDSGTYASVAVLDGTYHQIGETVTTPGYDIKYNFSGIIDFNTISLYGRYTGSAAHTVYVEIYDYIATDWVILGSLTSGSQDFMYSWTVESSRCLSSGAARVRIVHTSLGTNTHDLFVDFLGLI